MEIKIYLDSLFLLNLAMNFWMLKLLTYKFMPGIKTWRLIVSAMFAAGIYIAGLVLPVSGAWILYVEPVVSVPIMILFVLPKRKRRLFWKVMCWGFLYSFLISGILRTFFYKWQLFSGVQVHMLAVMTCGFLCTEGILQYLRRTKHTQKHSLCQVTIGGAQGNLRLRALLDTGNSLMEPISKRPVCLIEEQYLAQVTLENPLFLRAIPYRSVGCEQGVLYGVEVPALYITCGEEQYLVRDVICAGVERSLSAKGAYEMILHPALITEENKQKKKGEEKCCWGEI